MEDRLLVCALRSRDPEAIGAVYDAYADELFDYCWFQLHDNEVAEAALRDVLMCAQTHIGELRAPARFGPWLYALARIECRRRLPPGPRGPDVPVARHDQDDVDLRVMAWRAVTALPPLSRELLDLCHRRGLPTADVAAVAGLPGRDVEELLAQARVLLEAALVAEILAHDGPYTCESRAAVLRRRRGDLDHDLREDLVRHSIACDACARCLPRNVSVSKVYDLLPRAVPPGRLRGRVMSRVTDPEPAGHRLFAAARMPLFGSNGFPAQAEGRRPARPGRARWPRALIAVTGAVCVTVTAATMGRRLGAGTEDTQVIRSGPAGPRSRLPSPGPLLPPHAVRPVSAVFGLGASASDASSVPRGGVSRRGRIFARGVGRLELTSAHLTVPPGGSGVITLRAVGGTVEWRASAAGSVRVDPEAGVLAEGRTATVLVRVPDDDGGDASVTFWPGGLRAVVTWTAGPVRPVPAGTAPLGTGAPPPQPSHPAPRPSAPAPRPSTPRTSGPPVPSVPTPGDRHVPDPSS